MSRRAIGRLRRRLTAHEPVDAADQIGGAERSFTPRFELWAEIERTAGRSDFVAGREETVATHRIRIRHGSAVASGWRLTHGVRIFDVVSAPVDDAASGYVICQARELS